MIEIDDGWEPTSDYDDQMDAVQRGLLSYDDTHCVHGTFVGNWAGPDYMCFHCEMGTTDEDYAEIQRAAAEREEKRIKARKAWDWINTLSEPTKTAAQLAFIESGEWEHLRA